MAKLTDLEIGAFTCPPDKKIKKYSIEPGLYLWCMADGGKWWRLRYYIDGKERCMALGAYPKTGLAQARKAAEAQRELLKKGTDPAQAKKKQKAVEKQAKADSFEAIAREWFEAQSPEWGERYAQGMWARLEAHAFPVLGKMPVTAIEASDVIETLRKVQAAGYTQVAYRVLANISAVLDYAINSGRLVQNVAVGREGALKKHKAKNQAHVKPKEVPTLIKKITTYETIGNRQTMLALQLIALTFVRANELLQAQWSEFDIDNALWEIPAERMKMDRALLVPLAPQVIKILEELKAMNPESELILPGRGGKQGITNSTLLNALKLLGYAGKQTVHGFRHIASTALNEARNGDERMFDSDAIEAQLAHTTGGTRKVYNKAKYLPERRKIMLWWADHLDKMVQTS
ncbi:integrase arm-type DNA-binding domain-containing protein [Pseudomonas putida]|uniref:tyrosine-type recombinase/integrase n=1 Tax=Pseudomonas TaxID=286 RepID=UPI0035269168